MNRPNRLTLTAASVMFAIACTSAQVGAAEKPLATSASAPIAASIDSTARLVGDREEDVWRRPAAALEFLEIKPGMQVIDYFAGGGYYTELLSRIVGPKGKVIAYNNAPFERFAAGKPAQRYAQNRLANVTPILSTSESLTLEPNSLDAALFVQGYHDFYLKKTDGSWPPTDPAKSLARLMPALKSGAIVVVIDHTANAGADPSDDANDLHRIDPALVKRDFEAAGLRFVASSDAYANPEDDHKKIVFHPTIRHKTDQFVFKFRKP
jgi:predicted methyltransferase